MEQDERNQAPSSRPSSYYENMSENKRSSNNNVKECKFSESLSQMHCLNTTVPQNIGKKDIGGKHTPTRNSLRHSRMIVLNRSGQVTSSNTPLFLKHRKRVKAMMILTVLISFSLCILSLWLHVWSPNLEFKDYWSALAGLTSGSIGVMFVNICPRIYDRNVSYYIRSVKYISIMVSIVAATASLVVFTYALIQIVTLFSMVCSAYDAHDTTCVCRRQATDESGYHYVDLNCGEVRNALTGFFLYTCVANLIITVLKLVYLYLHWASRNVYIYTRVPVNDNSLRSSTASR